ncbi:hypothetical protein GHK46_04770 [Sinorhizobium medicae]|uniref:hypothetical protein n=1 Tax=Sinorhizobium medicae TaxID=110321 RepID=UPI0012960EF4|nr:hypothetical protein [Sinorhizobium medicae]MQV96774.1 hypothetical protein [Sinorhizobium medicae]
MFYRVSLTPYSVGDIIQPGQFGHRHRAHRPGAAYPVEPAFTELLIEIALESARKAVKPHVPSRLDCVFACESVADADFFRTEYRSGQGSIYEIEVASPDVPVFRGNFTAISTNAGGRPYVDYLSDWARDYWATVPTELVEVLIGGPVRIVALAG